MRCCQSLFLALTFLLVWNMPALSAEKKDAVLESITFKKDALKKESISFRLKGEHTPKIYMIKGENPRIVLDFIDTRCSAPANRNLDTNGKLTKKIRVGIHGDQPPMTRVVVDLAPKGDYQYTQHFNARDSILLLTIASTKADAGHMGQAAEESKPQAAKVSEVKKSPPSVQKGHPKPSQVDQGKKANKRVAKVSEKAPAPEPQGVVPVAMGEDKTAVGKGQTAAPGKETPDVQPKGMPPEPLLSAVTFENSTKGEMIIFKLNGYFPPKVVGSEKGEPRVICDFVNTHLGAQVKEVIHCKGKFVDSVRITQQKQGNKISAVLSLVPNRNYDLQQVFFKEDNLFVIIVNSQNTIQVEMTGR